MEKFLDAYGISILSQEDKQVKQKTWVTLNMERPQNFLNILLNYIQSLISQMSMIHVLYKSDGNGLPR